MTVESISGPTTWSGVELRHLQALLAVADEGTFSAAAARLGYTQSAVSQQISALERMVRVPLFDRPGGPRPVRLTEAGEVLVGHARSLLGRLRTAESDLQALAAGDHGVLRVGTLQSVGTRVLPNLLRRFGTERPGVEIDLRESQDAYVLLDWLEEGELDVTFAALPLRDGPFESRWVLDDPYVLVAPAGTPEAALSRLPLAAAADLPLVGNRNASCHFNAMQCFTDAGLTPRYVFRSDDNPTVQGYIAAGLGYGLLPMLAVDTADPGVRVLTVEPPPAPRQLVLVWHAERRETATLQAFVETATSVCSELSERFRTSAA